MKKVIAFSLLICFVFALSGCYLDVEYEFMYDASEIERIEIVELLEFDSENRRYNENIIVTIDNTEEFLQEFSEIHCEKIFGEPCMVESYMIVIKVAYLNGNY
ncbi:MAG: hypothetical protein J6V84_03455, partial [Clostridia bacterium]|nr:hypothetical protein [Clostridia bacterium]